MPDPAQWLRIEELYYDALAQPETERAAFLARVCASEDDMRREVESLLAARNEAGGFLSQPALKRSLLSGAAQAALNARLGSTIGHYQLLSVLGVGGMGEVFLAEDTRLHRQVALKLLPPQFSQQPGRVRRFEQEARATTALNHPNIVTLYDTGQHAGSYFIVNEFVDGQTLRECLNERGALPVSEALNIAQQIATALAAAHAAGIVHRDIKPENVMLRRDGFVKVLDFGLAKLTSTPPESFTEQDDTHDEENPPSTIHHPQSQTAAGALLGTIRYMSPEQARGGSVDAQTDVFSLGVVLYEMLTGRTPFHRETATETLAAILEAKPSALPASIPSALQRLVTSVLRKDRAERLQTAEAMAVALRGVAEETQFSVRWAEATGWRSWWQRWPLWLGVGAVLLAGYGWRSSRSNFETDILPKLKYTPVESWKTEPNQAFPVLSSSADGEWLAYAKVQNGQPDIFIKPVNDNPARNLTNDAWNDFGPVWSPDGKSIAYISLRGGQHEVWQRPFLGGQGQQLGTLPVRANWLTSWTQDGERIYYEAAGNLYMFEVATGASQPLTRFTSAYTDKEFAISRDDQWLAYKEKVANVVQLFVLPLNGAGTPAQLTHEGEYNGTPLWLPDGERLLYRSRRNGVEQICVAFRDGRAPIQITSGHENMTPWDVTPDSRRIFYFTKPEDEVDLFLLDVRTGAERRFSTGLTQELFPTFAPEGTHLVFQQSNQQRRFHEQTLFSQPLVGDERIRLSESGFDPHWSPRGDLIAYLRQQADDYQLWVVSSAGTNERQLVKSSVSFLGHADKPYGWTTPNFTWTPDGSQLVYGSLRTGSSNLFAIAADGSTETQLTANTDATLKLFSPVWSPDGKRLVYQGRRRIDGQVQTNVYLYEAGQSRLLWQTTGDVGLLGWSADQREFYAAHITALRVVAPVTVKLVSVKTAAANLTSRTTERVQFDNAYLQTFVLSPDARQLAYVTRQDNAANLWMVSLLNGQKRRLTANTDPSLGLGCLTWSPQADLIGFTKQSNTTSIWMIENFK